MSNRLTDTLAALQPRKALIPYLTAGDPAPEQTVAVMHALVEAGADVIELGVPFSDPMADGPVIQRACERALSAGTTLSTVLEDVAVFRRDNSHTPVVLMGYLNPVEAMGYMHFAERAQAAGVDGVLLVDLTPEEAGDIAPMLKNHGLAPVFLAAPNTGDERLQLIAQHADGYLYYVSLKGVTGSATLDTQAVGARVAQLQQHVELPVMVGFGISDADSACAIAAVSDGVIIGSALIQAMEAGDSAAAPDAAKAFLAKIRSAMDAQSSEQAA
ncbi:tryptophan synthase subunit alpha [bacterium]|nr:tryptophan synthase subunit alpha [bacterium]